MAILSCDGVERGRDTVRGRGRDAVVWQVYTPSFL